MVWALINPLITVGLLYFVFNLVTRVEMQGIPPLAFMLSGLCVWNYFSRSVGDSSQSLVGGQALIRKVYFPRIIIPLYKVISGLIELGIVLILLLLIMIGTDLSFGAQSIMIFPFLGLTILVSLAAGIWVSALSIRFRDFTHIMPLVLRMGLFLSPVAYSTISVPERYRWLYELNPLSGIIDGMRWALFDTPMDWHGVWISMAVTLILLLTGIWYFRSMERYIADII